LSRRAPLGVKIKKRKFEKIQKLQKKFGKKCNEKKNKN